MSCRWPTVDVPNRRTASPTATHCNPNAAPPAQLTPPPPGRAVLACRCGVMLDLDDMRRPTRQWDRTPSGAPIEPICCARCARRELDR
jgi:hypothetical protein